MHREVHVLTPGDLIEQVQRFNLASVRRGASLKRSPLRMCART